MSGLLDVILLYDCNLACEFCTVMADVGVAEGVAETLRGRSLPAAKVAQAMRADRARGFDAIAFTGGEPTLRADLLPLVRKARELGFASVKLQTNGLVFATPANLDRAVDAGVTRFHLTIHAHRDEVYDALVRTPGRHAAMVAALDAMVARELDPTIDVLVSRRTLPELVTAVQWLADRGIRRVDLWMVSLTDANRAHVAMLPSYEEALPTVHEALALARARGLTLRSLHLPRCVLGDDHPHAYDPGRALEHGGRVHVLSPDDDFELAASKLTPQTKVPACTGCPHEAACPGLRPDYLEVFGDREIARIRGLPSTLAPRRRLAVQR
jgi:MoaA/NifB/PqqE/SkfB family radical SAM enzyme